jgi:hypothetical protein
MRALLAERILAKVMGWDSREVANERPIIQVLADLKYDAYQQYSPGMRFVENLALWLEQFNEADERKIAYNFMKSNLVYFSHDEMAHFAATVYPDYIKPRLIKHAAILSNIPDYHIESVVSSNAFKSLQDLTLFFGLSDGARIDQFRRSNRELSHERIFQNYELSAEKISSIKDSLPNGEYVRAIVLLDDFTASGTSYIRKENDTYTGKIAKILSHIKDDEAWKNLVVTSELLIIIAVYVATSTAIRKINKEIVDIWGQDSSYIFVTAVQQLGDEIRITQNSSHDFVKLSEKYYDPSIETDHTKKGGTDLKFGYAGCGLPVILHHNSPNNSLFLLSAEENSSTRALFPRVSRHKGEV